MSVLLVLALSGGLTAFVVPVVVDQIRRRKPKELRGDWWPRFEAQFREYAQGWEGTASIRRRDVRSRSRPPKSG